MIPVKHIDPEDLPLYAMHLLAPEDMSEMQEQLQHSLEGRRILSETYSDLAVLAHSTEMHPPSALARQRLMKHVAREKKIIPIDTASTYLPQAASTPLQERSAHKSVATRVLPWVGWALAAGMLLPLVNFYRQREERQGQLEQLRTALAANQSQIQQTQASAELANTLMNTVKDPNAVHVTLTGSEIKPPPEGRASYVAAKGSLVFIASNLNPIEGGKTYELWLIPTEGSAIPAGTFRPDARGNASVILPELPRGVAAKAFGVTLENAEGSTTPTAPILLKGAVY